MAFHHFPCIFLFSLHVYMIHANILESNDKISSSLNFLTNLRGAEKGNYQKGVDELKKHLSFLGYMDYDHTYHDEHANIFDDSLELGLKKYQEFHYLNITGVLDSNTLQHMQQPRCGMPDLHNPNKTLIPFHMHYAFFPGQPKWSKRTLKYWFDLNVQEYQKPPLEQALHEWASSIPFKFVHVPHIEKADIRLSFMPKDHGDGYPFGEHNKAMAHTFAPPDGRVHFDASLPWSDRVERDAFDIKTVGLHELGHALGLAHSRIREAVMYPKIDLGERKTLIDDDVEGIKALYEL